MQERKISTTLASSRQKMHKRPSCSLIESIDNWMKQEETKMHSTHVSRLITTRKTMQWIELNGVRLK